MITHRPHDLPLVGALPALAADPLAFFEANRRLGDVVAYKVGPTPVVQLSHPDLVEQVLVHERHRTRKDHVTRGLSGVLGDGLLTSEGATWQRQRKMAAPSFTPRQLGAYADTMVRSTEERLPEAGEVEVHRLMSRITLDIVVRTLFGVEPGGEADRVAPLLDVMSEAFEHEQRSLWRFVPDWVPSPARRRVDDGVRELDGILHRLIAAADPGGDDLLARLRAARDEEGRPMDRVQLRDSLITLFLAGHETTALTLTYALWLLAEHPELQDRARDDEAFVDAVICEAMRLYPPAWIIGREVAEPFAVGGVELEVGQQLVMSQWVVHRDPRWWVGAERFRPDRWTNGETERLPRFAYFPFGGGPRVCIGNHFARMEASRVLATFLRHRSVAAVPGETLELVPAVTLRPRRAMLKVT